jgi:GntR family transcriptional regulator
MYMQLKEILAKKIRSGFYHDGEKLPSERELCETYNVSRITVRQALAELENASMIIRFHGKGTYVSQPKLEQELCNITPFKNSLLNKGMNPETRNISYKEVPNSYQYSKTLNIPISENIAELVLLGLGDKKPMAYYTSYFNVKLGARINELSCQLISENQSFTTLDLYQTLDDIIVGAVYQTFEASISDKYISKLLEISVGSPILIVESIVYSSNDDPLEFRTAIYRGDMYKFSIVRNYKGSSPKVGAR